MNRIQAMHDELRLISSANEFDNWVRDSFRLELPCAAFLVTVGKLYGVGSVPTHRLAVDFPLELLETLKNAAGALDDPPLYEWFRTQKLKYRDFHKVAPHGVHRIWRNSYLSYGFNEILIHGIMNHELRQFATFQIYNPCGSGSVENATLLSSLTSEMAEACWRIFFTKQINQVTNTERVGHPTLALTVTELHIIQLLAQGLSNKEIARLRGVSDSTVKTQVQRTGSKVGAKRRAEIVALALPFLSPLPPQSLVDYGE